MTSEKTLTTSELVARSTRRQIAAVAKAKDALRAAIKTNSYGDFESCSLPTQAGKRGESSVRIQVLEGFSSSRCTCSGWKAQKHVEYLTTAQLLAAVEKLEAATKKAKRTEAYRAAAKREKRAEQAAAELARVTRETALAGERERLASLGCSAEWVETLLTTRAGQVLRDAGREMYDGEENREAHEALSYAIANQSSAWKAWQSGDIDDAGHLISLCVGAKRRHEETDYDEIVTDLRARGWSREEARQEAREQVSL